VLIALVEKQEPAVWVVMIILQHERRGVVVGVVLFHPFIDSTASSRFIGIATTER